MIERCHTGVAGTQHWNFNALRATRAMRLRNVTLFTTTLQGMVPAHRSTPSRLVALPIFKCMWHVYVVQCSVIVQPTQRIVWHHSKCWRNRSVITLDYLFWSTRVECKSWLIERCKSFDKYCGRVDTTVQWCFFQSGFSFSLSRWLSSSGSSSWKTSSKITTSITISTTKL